MAKALAKDPNPNKFWAAATQAVGSIGTEVARFLVNAFAGQGASERMNKKVKLFRTVNRNRQSHKVTEAYVEISMGIRSKAGPPTKTYLQFRKEHIEELRVLKAEIAADALAAVVPAEEPALVGEEEEEGGGWRKRRTSTTKAQTEIEEEPVLDKAE